MNTESDLYALPKNILIGMLCTIQQECKEKHEKELEKYKFLELACNSLFPEMFRKFSTMKIIECQAPGCNSYSVMDMYYWVGVHKNCSDMLDIECKQDPEKIHYLCNKHFDTEFIVDGCHCSTKSE